MSLDRDALVEALQYIDKLIGDAYTEIAVHENKDNQRVKITAKCRVCKAEISEDRSYANPGWGAQLIRDIRARAEKHARQHQLILPRGH